MAVYDLYSYRKRVTESGNLDVLIYDDLPEKLRIQIIRIWRNAIGPAHVFQGYDSYLDVVQNNHAWHQIHEIIAQEHGLISLSHEENLFERCSTFLLGANVEQALDIIETSFTYIDKEARDFSEYDLERCGIFDTAEDAIDELNERFRRAGVGYRYEDSMIIRIDSELIHSEVVKPALLYLHQQGFEGPCDEFMKAHELYRDGDMKGAITNANNAFESTLKTICDQNKWQYSQGSTASNLLRVVREKGLLPHNLDKSFAQLTATLQSGLPNVRNEQGGHGQGSKPQKTPEYIAAYALHLAATKILFLCEAHKAMSK